MADPTGVNLTAAQAARADLADPVAQEFSLFERLRVLRNDVDNQHTVVKVTVKAADLTAAATSETLTLFTPDEGLPFKVVDVVPDLQEVFAGGSVSAITAEVGEDDTPDTDEFMAAVDVFTGAPLGSNVGTLVAGQLYWAAGTAVTATFATTGDNVVNLTTGEVDFYVTYKLLTT